MSKMLDPQYLGFGESPWQAMIDASKFFAKQVISRCSSVELLERASDILSGTTEQWRIDAIVKRIEELRKEKEKRNG